MSKIKKCSKTCYEIKDCEDIIYISKEQIPSTEQYLYFIDVYHKNEKSAYINDHFDELWEALEILHYNLGVPKSITKKIKGI